MKFVKFGHPYKNQEKANSCYVNFDLVRGIFLEEHDEDFKVVANLEDELAVEKFDSLEAAQARLDELLAILGA